ncbi:MAG: N-acetyl-gamma-glutamyl-phosphate reductase [Synergistaceae bacterium]|nr:N-acetyl-gamma-glutamyl-phosphate reductase [Synergistaceae bacterium]
MTKIFIDGSAGTTGLQIHERLKARKDITLLKLNEDERKNLDARKKFLNEADIVFLCLPDSAAVEAVSLVENNHTVVIDTSTAHRTSEGWTYGMPELANAREKIKNSKRIANPGCHASGFIALVAPLVENNLISPEEKLTAFSITGYSGGGKKMIAEYQNPQRNILFNAPRQYALTQTHKHLPEMTKLCGLKHAPVFCPIVANFYSGMEVTVALHNVNLGQIKEVYKAYYSQGGLIKFDVPEGNVNSKTSKEVYNAYYSQGGLINLDGPEGNVNSKTNQEGYNASYSREGLIKFNDSENDEGGFVSASAFSGRDDMEITVQGNDERCLLISRFDNLGKGASGAAVQNMNLIMGINEFTGLNV